MTRNGATRTKKHADATPVDDLDVLVAEELAKTDELLGDFDDAPIDGPLVVAVLKRLADLGQGGNVAAAQLFLEHMLGKPVEPELPSDSYPISLDLPEVRTPSDASRSIRIIHEAWQRGDIGASAAHALLETVRLEVLVLQLKLNEDLLAAITQILRRTAGANVRP